MVNDHSDLTIVRSTIDLSHNLGLTVVAEGVEDGETLERLAALHCDRAQGYFVSRPLPADAFTAWMQSPEVLDEVRAHLATAHEARGRQSQDAAGSATTRGVTPDEISAHLTQYGGLSSPNE